MVTKKKKPARRKRKPVRKKGWFAANLFRILIFSLLFLLLVVSLLSASYVIFFRTVFAQESAPPSGAIVFEEPNPPEHESTEEIVQGGIGKEAITSNAITTGRPRVAIIIDDMGYHKRLGEKIINLPFHITYSFLPFAPYTHELEALAISLQKTILLHLPLEPQDESLSPGPGALLLSDSTDEQLRKFEASLAEIQHAVGVNNHMGSKFTENEYAMRSLLIKVKEQTLFYIDSYTTAESVGLKIARELGIRSARRHVFLDNVLDETVICSEIDRLVKLAEQQGTAIGIGHPHSETLTAINDCAPKYLERVDYVRVTKVLE